MADLQNDASEKLAGHVQALETLAAEKKEVGEAFNLAMKDCENEGFDKAIVKMILKRRQMSKDEVSKQDELIEVYEAALQRQGELSLKPERLPIGRGASDAATANIAASMDAAKAKRELEAMQAEDAAAASKELPVADMTVKAVRAPSK